ncbi:MAG: hypothetical protein JWO73_87 [Candidatus Taylorbacteria bacterium]|nr:hypothetical protein [Candidatus Taylorbacteria bacterium]
MEKLEQPIPTQEITPIEVLRMKASDKIKEDIASAKKRTEETHLSDDFVLISKIDVQQQEAEQEKIASYNEELKEVEAGTINPEYIIFSHGDADEKLELMTEKISPDSELAGVLKSEQEVRSLPAEESDFIRKYESDLNRLRDITARHKEVEKGMRERGVGQEDEVWLRSDKDNLELDLGKRRDAFFKDMDPERTEELKSLGGRFGKRDALRSQVMAGRGFTDTSFTPYTVRKADGSEQEVLSYYGQVDKLHSDFRNAGETHFPKNPEKAGVAEKRVEQKTEEAGPVEPSKFEIPKVIEQDAEALRKVRESLGINTPSLENEASRESETFFVSPESVGGYKKTVEQMSDYFGSLDRVLRNRDDERLAELIDVNEIGRMSSTMKKLGEMDIKEPQDFDEMSASFARLQDSVETIGTMRSRNVKEDVDSLKSIANALMMVGESTQDVGRQLKTMETQEALQAAKQAYRLADVLFDRRMAMLRRMDQVGDYLRY